jgi:hypothetical protein
VYNYVYFYRRWLKAILQNLFDDAAVEYRQQENQLSATPALGLSKEDTACLDDLEDGIANPKKLDDLCGIMVL